MSHKRRLSALVLVSILLAHSSGWANGPQTDCRASAAKLQSAARIAALEKQREAIRRSIRPVDLGSASDLADVLALSELALLTSGGVLYGLFSAGSDPNAQVTGMAVGGGLGGTLGALGVFVVEPLIKAWAYGPNYFKQKRVDRLTRLIEGLKAAEPPAPSHRLSLSGIWQRPADEWQKAISDLLGRSISDAELGVIYQAHLDGIPKPGQPYGFGDYRRIVSTLQRSGYFTEDERRKLIEAGACGLPELMAAGAAGLAVAGGIHLLYGPHDDGGSFPRKPTAAETEENRRSLRGLLGVVAASTAVFAGGSFALFKTVDAKRESQTQDCSARGGVYDSWGQSCSCYRPTGGQITYEKGLEQDGWKYKGQCDYSYTDLEGK